MQFDPAGAEVHDGASRYRRCTQCKLDFKIFFIVEEMQLQQVVVTSLFCSSKLEILQTNFFGSNGVERGGERVQVSLFKGEC